MMYSIRIIMVIYLHYPIYFFNLLFPEEFEGYVCTVSWAETCLIPPQQFTLVRTPPSEPHVPSSVPTDWQAPGFSWDSPCQRGTKSGSVAKMNCCIRIRCVSVHLTWISFYHLQLFYIMLVINLSSMLWPQEVFTNFSLAICIIYI